jgi:hypothetical protein
MKREQRAALLWLILNLSVTTVFLMNWRWGYQLYPAIYQSVCNALILAVFFMGIGAGGGC